MKAIQQDSAQYTKDYNTLDWTVIASLKNNFSDNIYILDSQNINKIVIKNSLESWGSTIQILYLDINFQLSDFLYRNNLILQLYLKSPQMIQDQPAAQLNISFFIDNIILVQITEQQSIYKLTGQQVNNLLLNQNINYATNKKNGSVSPYKIIQQILENIQYKFDTSYVDTTERINFITYKNQTIKDVIEYCLSVGMNFKSPPYFFMHRLIDDTAMLVNQFSKDKCLLKPYNLTLQLKTDGNVKIQTIYNIVADLTTFTFQGGTNNILSLKNTTFFDYDHNSRTWTKTVYNDKDIINALTNTSNTNINTFTNKKILNKLQNNIYHSNFMQGQLYRHARNLTFGSDSIQFNIGGCLTRDCGQFVSLDTNQNPKIAREFNNMWQIYLCAHIWENKTYYNDLICFRTSLLKETQLNVKAVEK